MLPVLLSQVPPGGMWEALCLTQQAEAAWEGSRGYVQMGTMLALRDTLTAGCACCSGRLASLLHSMVTLSTQSCVAKDTALLFGSWSLVIAIKPVWY